MKRLLLSVLAVLSILLIDCKKLEVLPPIPVITFKSFQFADTLDKLQNWVKHGTLIFNLVDGDGDVGLKDGEKDVNGDSLNLFIQLYNKKNGKYEKIPLAPKGIPLYYKLPDMTPIGQNKTLKVEVKVEFDYNIKPTNLFPYDTVRYVFYVTDRAANKSNILSTPVILVKNKGIITDSTITK